MTDPPRLPPFARKSLRHSAPAGLLLVGLLSACTDWLTGSHSEPTISLDFEGSSLGSYSVIGKDSLAISLRLDTNAPERFWFSFRLHDARGRTVTLLLQDAFEAAHPGIWYLKRPVASGDGGQSWARITDTEVTSDAFVFRHRPSSSAELVALALPYQFSRWTALVASMTDSPWVRAVRTIGQSLDGNPLDLVEITDPSTSASGKTGLWVMARQHPGEPEGSYMLEGFLAWILGNDPTAAQLRRRAEVYVAGFLNPDGVLAGNQRVNLAGLDLNRQWTAPDPTTAPTIVAVQDEILGYVEAGGRVRILVDFHGAPAAESNYFYYNDESDTGSALHGEIVRVMETAIGINPDFASLEGSEARPVEPGERARNWAFARLGAQGLTVEAGANDVTYGPFEGQWITESRLLALGEAVGRSIAETLYGIDGAALARVPSRPGRPVVTGR